MPTTASQPYGVWTELRVIRTKDGQTLTSLAATTTLSLSYLSDLERGRRLPSAEATKKLAQALNVPVSVLERERRVDQNGHDVTLRDFILQVLAEHQSAAA